MPTTPSSPGPQLGVIGDVVEDVVVLMHGAFGRGSDTPSRIVHRPGGSAANMAVAAAKLVPTRFFGCIGDDATGARLRLELAEDMDVRLQVTSKAPTGTIVVLVDARGERHMFPDRGANTCLGPIDDDELCDLTALHATAYSLVDGSTANVVTSLVTRLGRWGKVTSFDVSSAAMIEQLGVPNLLDRIEVMAPTIVMANEAEAALLGWDVAKPSTNRMIMVKRGPGAALVRTPLGAWLLPPTPLDVTDTTGAGDAFAAGVMAAVVNQGLTPEDLLNCAEPLAVALLQAGHSQAAAWLKRR